MFLFILGVVSGLALGQLVVHAESVWHRRADTRQAEFDIAVAQAIANANPSVADQWTSGQWAKDEARIDASWESCGCHSNWNEHEAFMLKGVTKTSGPENW